MTLKTEARISMTKLEITMITDIVIRYADKITVSNEIADFKKLNIFGNNISALSWEVPGSSRNQLGEILLKKMAEKLMPNNKSKTLHVMVELSAEQPDNAIVNYKKAWGLLESFGVNIDNIENKKSYLKKGENGLILRAVGTVNAKINGVIQNLLDSEIKTYISIFKSQELCEELLNSQSPAEWMNTTWENNGVIFMLLGHFDEKDCEVVALGNSKNLKHFLI